MTTQTPPSQGISRSVVARQTLTALEVAIGVVWLWLTVELLKPIFSATSQTQETTEKLVPDYSLEAWRAFPISEGRLKPLETASAELVRLITGRERFAKTES